MQDGTILSLVAEKGFGFIKPASGGADIFFHCSSINAPMEALVPGQDVKYELDATSERPKARRVETAGIPATRRSAQRNTRPSSNLASRDSRPADGRQALEHGFITKLRRKSFCGFISSIRHGPEYLFAAQSVSGEKLFSRLEIGDYVQFQVGEPAPADPGQPIAKAVRVVHREVRIRGEKQLGRHPKARKKKPTWRR